MLVHFDFSMITFDQLGSLQGQSFIMDADGALQAG